MESIIVLRILPAQYLRLDTALRRHLGQVSRALAQAVVVHWRMLCERVRFGLQRANNARRAEWEAAHLSRRAPKPERVPMPRFLRRQRVLDV